MDDNVRSASGAAAAAGTGTSYRYYTTALTATGDRRTAANSASNTTNTTTLIPLPMGAELHVSFGGDAHSDGAVPPEGVVTVLPDEDDDDDDGDGIEEEEEEDDDDQEEPEGQDVTEAADEVEDRRRLLDRTGTILFGPAPEVVGGHDPANGSPAVDGVAEGGGAGMLIYFH